MYPSEYSPKVREQLQALEQKYAAHGQDLASYLEGLLHTDYLSYWDYIHLDTLLSLQNPKTNFPDEVIFITYHQVTELYFKMILLEMQQLGSKEDMGAVFFQQRVNRINRYFEILVQSFDVMGKGMEQEQFLKFRMALIPASGFQSAQFRLIEIHATEFINLVDKEVRQGLDGTLPIEQLYPYIYWKKGAIEKATGKETLTLQKFEEKYDSLLINQATSCKSTNLWVAYLQLSSSEKANKAVIEALRLFDTLINIDWPLAHFKSAMHYLHKDNKTIEATGGTNWQQYLPPFFQKRIFYPQLWTAEEKKNWGKEWVEKNVLQAKGK